MIESLFGANSANSSSIPKETPRKSVIPPIQYENRVLDPKKSQNIAILLRALNVTRDEVTEALLDGMGFLFLICNLYLIKSLLKTTEKKTLPISIFI